STSFDLFLTGDGGAGFDMGFFTNNSARQKLRARADASACLHLNCANPQNVAVEPVTRKVYFGLNRGVIAQSQQTGYRWQRVEVNVFADLDAEHSGIGKHPRRAGDRTRA